MLCERELVVLGRYPWNSGESVPAVSMSQSIDSTNEINKCLRCRKKKCNNCLCKDQTFIMHDKCETLISKGMTSRQICAKLHISRATFFRYKQACAAV